MTCATCVVSGTPGNPVILRHDWPPFSLTWMSPSSVPIQSCPSLSGDSATATMAPKNELDVFFATASTLHTRSIILIRLRSIWRVRSLLTARQLLPRSSLRKRRCDPKYRRVLLCGLMMSGESQYQRSAPSVVSGCGTMLTDSPLCRLNRCRLPCCDSAYTVFGSLGSTRV